MCFYYGNLNEVTLNDAQPMPNVDEYLAALARQNILNTGCKNSYQQIDMAAEDIKKVALRCKEGLF